MSKKEYEIQIRIPEEYGMDDSSVARLRKAFRIELASVMKRGSDDPPVNDINITTPRRRRKPAPAKKSSKKSKG